MRVRPGWTSEDKTTLQYQHMVMSAMGPLSSEASGQTRLNPSQEPHVAPAGGSASPPRLRVRPREHHIRAPSWWCGCRAKHARRTAGHLSVGPLLRQHLLRPWTPPLPPGPPLLCLRPPPRPFSHARRAPPSPSPPAWWRAPRRHSTMATTSVPCVPWRGGRGGGGGEGSVLSHRPHPLLCPSPLPLQMARRDARVPLASRRRSRQPWQVPTTSDDHQM